MKLTPDVEIKQEPNDSTAESTPMPISLTQSRETTVKSELIEEKSNKLKKQSRNSKRKLKVVIHLFQKKLIKSFLITNRY